MRAAGRIKMGYFPLPIAEGPRIRARLSFSERASAVDPCAGTGAALLAVTSGAEVERYAAAHDFQALSKYPFVFVGDPYQKRKRNSAA